MPTTGTTSFDLDFTEIAEEAWELAGREMRTGYDLRTARRSLNLMLIEWQNRGINLWSIEEGSQALTQGTQNYSLTAAADTIDFLEQVIRTGSGSTQQDLTISRISPSTWASIPNKNATGRPIQIWIDRQRDNPEVNVWPIPDSNDYTLYYWRLRRLQDAGFGAETQDVVFRFLPALTAGLAYKLSVKDPALSARAPMLKEMYEEAFQMAAEEDRVKTPARFVPAATRM